MRNTNDILPAVGRFKRIFQQQRDHDTASKLMVGRVQVFETLVQEYKPRFAERTSSLIRLCPQLHPFIGSTWDPEVAEQDRRRFKDVEDLDGLIEEIAKKIDSLTDEMLREAGFSSAE